MYLLDTDTLSNLIKRRPSTALIARLAATPVPDQATSSIAVGELIYGALRVSSRYPGLAERIEAVLLRNLRVEPFDVEAAHVYGSLRAELEAGGRVVAEADLRIASIALARDLILVTGNLRHFINIPELRVENWLE